MARQIVTFDDDYEYEEPKKTKSYSESSRYDDDDESDIDRALRDSMRLLKESKNSSYDDDDPFGDDFDNAYSEGAHEIAERPTAKIKDQYEVPVPKSSDIPLDAYSKQLADLRRSFKENVELIDMYENDL